MARQAQGGLRRARTKAEGVQGKHRSYRTFRAPLLTLPYILFVMGAIGGFGAGESRDLPLVLIAFVWGLG